MLLQIVRTVPALTCQEPAYTDLKPLIVLLIVVFIVLAPLGMFALLTWNYLKGRITLDKHRKRYGILFESECAS